jgi:hypothetical protein
MRIKKRSLDLPESILVAQFVLVFTALLIVIL